MPHNILQPQNSVFLYSVPVHEVVINANSENGARNFDQDDLKTFVGIARKLPRIPGIKFDGTTVHATSGISFIIAARNCSPPMTNIICQSANACPASMVGRVKRVLPSELLELEETEPRWDILFFNDPIDGGVRIAIERMFRGFIDSVNNQYQIGTAHIISMEWNHEKTRLDVQWTHPAWCAEQEWEVLDVVNKIAESAHIRSVNGYRGREVTGCPEV